jgi:hypothetical protein
MDPSLRWDDEEGRLSSKGKEKRKELDPGLRRDDEVGLLPE